MIKFTVPCDMYNGCGGCKRTGFDGIPSSSKPCMGKSLRILTIPEIKKLADDWKPSNDCHYYLFKPKEE